MKKIQNIQPKQLSKIDNKQFLQELKERIKTTKIKEVEVAKILAQAEAEAWKKDYELAAQDEERNKEAEEWDNLEDDEN
ncbi:MAG: hypothetical protein I3273_04590 [Candidatus Moeniiplasma glomeromycotorum]|nr:hypothetical protein [Candidatus Moeniiplasma glomeromycotorum]MCE8169373.1 hypothetical protein [Candidatus Moeniiplasma glomeromycotorum]